MERLFNKSILMLALMALVSCGDKEKAEKNETVIVAAQNEIKGSWLLVYGETRTADTVEVKDLSDTEFIKILNEDHFAFFNQNKDTAEGFYGGGGTYSLKGNVYTERLDYIGAKELRGHEFTFEIAIKGDTLIQSGVEDVPDAGINRHIVEKYIRIKD
ncbi:hypothetical protein K1F50_16305 [Muricauda oceani]|uniref:Lipocalin-like domain-containing protein n=1 Tax=Flagellimonas oceani TaxID=2698672 RepID=A0A6G7IXD4_9FLAO|nr:hypothetical protein [Allomuricauda oceani]MBW8244373.1 hypothetical protein [Allomuricauda oceani]QII43216.1 hypothetical protein GVT53_00420 [Allomuricauda oceani]